jgi:hypothetical protein
MSSVIASRRHQSATGEGDLVITAALAGGASAYRMSMITGLSQTMVSKIRKHA